LNRSPAAERTGSPFIWERLSAAIGDVNRILREDDGRISPRNEVASPQVICNYGGDLCGVGRAWHNKRQPVHWKMMGGYWMKKLASAIAILCATVLIAACSKQAQIDAATQKATSAAQRSEAAATTAQTASQNAMAASQKADQEAASAQDSVRRANDAVARLEAAFSTSVTK
jgi:hypothetical protein